MQRLEHGRTDPAIYQHRPCSEPVSSTWFASPSLPWDEHKTISVYWSKSDMYVQTRGTAQSAAKVLPVRGHVNLLFKPIADTKSPAGIRDVSYDVHSPKIQGLVTPQLTHCQFLPPP